MFSAAVVIGALRVKTILGQVNFLTSFHDKTPVNLKQVEDRLLEIHKLDWANKIETVPQLRTYKQFISEHCTEKKCPVYFVEN